MNTDFFSCPRCQSDKLIQAATSWVCVQCRTTFPLHAGIPFLVTDVTTHIQSMERLARSNPQWYLKPQARENDRYYRRHREKRRLYVEQYLKALCSSHGRRMSALLDCGCGDGQHLPWLSNYADTLYGCDYNPERLLRAPASISQPATLFLADIGNFPAKNEFFDLIFCNHVLEHIPDDLQALRSLRRILSPDGTLVLGVPNEGAWWWQLAYRLEPRLARTTDHLHFYTLASLKKLLGKSGFTVVETKRIGWGVAHWSLDARLRSVGWIDDLMSIVGSILMPSQSSSLYVIAQPDKITPVPSSR